MKDRKKEKGSLSPDLDPDHIQDQDRGRDQGRGPVLEKERGHEDRLRQDHQEVHREEEQEEDDLFPQAIHDLGPDHCQFQVRQVIPFVVKFEDTKRQRLPQRLMAKRTTVFLVRCNLRLHRIPLQQVLNSHHHPKFLFKTEQTMKLVLVCLANYW